MEEFTERYGTREDGRYVITRDLATYAITKEVEAGRGSPHGGVYLSFQHCSDADLRQAFGPVIDRLHRNGIDLKRMPVEVAPIAHYHMGGIRVNADMETSVPGLFAAGEAVGGANGANRVSGNGVTEALVFGRRAGDRAAALSLKLARPDCSQAEISAVSERLLDVDPGLQINPAAEIAALQTTMNKDVGPFRHAGGLRRALAHLERLRTVCRRPPPRAAGLDPVFIDWLDLHNMRLIGECVARAALEREESRGAHQREEWPGLKSEWQRHQTVTAAGEQLTLGHAPAHDAVAA
jgi:succinate dehydrogenase/fumarate reductase flavoprotein subunit